MQAARIVTGKRVVRRLETYVNEAAHMEQPNREYGPLTGEPRV